MIPQRLKKQWSDFKRSRPGSRFRDRYERHKKNPSPWWARVLQIGGGLLMIVVGLFFAVAPGPASIFFFLGGGLLASESLLIARLMDWLEVKCRLVVAWAKKRWRRLSRPGKGAVIALAAAGSGACVFVSYLVMFRH
jgi:hypothetical protein